ncbi:MAG: prolipoprotein diacylglyceryl transferase family protein, partial [Flavobacteriales bacterium]
AIGYIILFFILKQTYKSEYKNKPGFMLGLFFVGMFVIRFLVEYIKESQGGFEDLIPLFSTGQWLSIPFVALGGFLMLRSSKTTQNEV